MAIEMDLGTILFRDILKIADYCSGCPPFSGNIINDIVLYFFVPMVFMIFFIYLLLGRIVAGVMWLRMLVGIALFMFMVVNGWFAMFALLAGPYFVFLIVVLGALFFIPAHFRFGGGGGRATAMPAATMGRNVGEIRKRLNEITKDIPEKEKELSHLIQLPGGDKAAAIVRQEIQDLKRERYELERIINPLKRYV